MHMRWGVTRRPRSRIVVMSSSAVRIGREPIDKNCQQASRVGGLAGRAQALTRSVSSARSAPHAASASTPLSGTMMRTVAPPRLLTSTSCVRSAPPRDPVSRRSVGPSTSTSAGRFASNAIGRVTPPGIRSTRRPRSVKTAFTSSPRSRSPKASAEVAPRPRRARSTRRTTRCTARPAPARVRVPTRFPRASAPAYGSSQPAFACSNSQTHGISPVAGRRPMLKQSAPPPTPEGTPPPNPGSDGKTRPIWCETPSEEVQNGRKTSGCATIGEMSAEVQMPLLVGGIIDNAARVEPHAVAATLGDDSLTFGALDSAANRVARARYPRRARRRPGRVVGRHRVGSDPGVRRSRGSVPCSRR